MKKEIEKIYAKWRDSYSGACLIQSSNDTVFSAVTGYAFEFILTDERDVFCIFKDGINAGVEAIVSYYPQHDVFVSMLANKNGGLYDMHKEIQMYIWSLKEALP